MKKTIILIAVLTCVACMSQAATFVWGSSDRAQFGIGSFVTDGSVIGHLVFLGMTDGSTYSIDGYNVVNSELATKASSSIGMASQKGSIKSEFEATMDSVIGNNGTMSNGAVFGMFTTYTDGAGKDWINISSSTYTISRLEDDGSELDNASFAFNWDVHGAGTPLTSGGGWVPVPEPSVGLLALAGIGMLIRRKRA